MTRSLLPNRLLSFTLSVLQLMSQVSHPWVDQYMQIKGHPDMHGWDSASPPMIGDIVSAVIREFGRESTGGNPPGWAANEGRGVSGPGMQQPAPFVARGPPAAHFAGGDIPRGRGAGGAGDSPASSATRPTSTPSPVPRVSREVHRTPSAEYSNSYTHTPPVPTKFEEINKKSTKEISHLLEDDDARRALLLGMPYVVRTKELRTDVRKGNVDTAQSILSKHEEGLRIREEAKEMRSELLSLQNIFQGGSSIRSRKQQRLMPCRVSVRGR